MRTNPHGANGSSRDPREQKMWDIYVDNIAKGTENAYKAAIQAGYEEATARQITIRSWFIERKEKLKRKEMLSKAERNLDRILDLKIENDEGKILPEITKIVVDVSKTIVTTLGKDKGYSTRNETDITSGGEKLVFLPKEVIDKLNESTQQTEGSNNEQ